jgi:hypothetical protein
MVPCARQRRSADIGAAVTFVAGWSVA